MGNGLDAIKEYLRAISKNLSLGNATEHTHRPALKSLVETINVSIVATFKRKLAVGRVVLVIRRKIV